MLMKLYYKKLKIMLEKPCINTKDIAIKSGFNSLSTFNIRFYKLEWRHLKNRLTLIQRLNNHLSTKHTIKK